MPDKELIVRESGTHWTIRLPVDYHDLVVMVDKKDFTMTIPYFEYMNVFSIVKGLVQAAKDNENSPVILDFLKFLNEPVNAEELEKFKYVFDHRSK